MDTLELAMIAAVLTVQGVGEGWEMLVGLLFLEYVRSVDMQSQTQCKATLRAIVVIMAGVVAWETVLACSQHS